MRLFFGSYATDVSIEKKGRILKDCFGALKPCAVAMLTILIMVSRSIKPLELQSCKLLKESCFCNAAQAHRHQATLILQNRFEA